jgi:hypothetical protein
MSKRILNYTDIPTEYIMVKGVQYAYRSLGTPSEVPIVCLQHFTGTLDNWDPIIIDGLSKQRQVVMIDRIRTYKSATQRNFNSSTKAGYIKIMNN